LSLHRGALFQASSPVIQRETDPDFINRIANLPEVLPHLDYRGAGMLDFSPAVGRITTTGIVWLSNGEDAVAAFEQAADRAYNVHLMFACHGAKALEAGRAMLEYMRPWVDELWGLIPIANKAARWFARRMGFVHAHLTNDPAMGECEALVWRPA
jgi:hypothetical protein